MAADNEVLWTVTERHWMDPAPKRVYVFRTRYAARKFRATKMGRKANKDKRYTVHRAVWGPDK